MTLLAASLLMLVSTAASPDTRHAVLFHTDGRFEAISGSALDAPPQPAFITPGSGVRSPRRAASFRASCHARDRLQYRRQGPAP
jgi:hypothetical protein